MDWLRYWFHYILQRRGPRPGSEILIPERDSSGTFGCVVREKQAPGRRLVLTCQHVVAGCFSNEGVGFSVLASNRVRWKPEKPKKPENLSPLGKVVHIGGLSPDGVSDLDCALILPHANSRVSARFPFRLGRVRPSPLSSQEIEKGLRVQKVGSQTGHTLGRISGFCSSLVHDRDEQTSAEYDNLIELEPEWRHSDDDRSLDFCRGGDSGTVVLTRERRPRPIGLLISRDRAKMLRHGRAIPLEKITQMLSIDICSQ